MLNLNEVRERIHKDKEWQVRAVDIELFHFEMMLYKKKWSLRKTARILNMCPSTICEDLMLSKFLLRDENLRRIRFRNEALKYIRSLK